MSPESLMSAMMAVLSGVMLAISAMEPPRLISLQPSMHCWPMQYQPSPMPGAMISWTSHSVSQEMPHLYSAISISSMIGNQQWSIAP